MVKYYYAGGQRVAMRKGTGNPTYLFGDHLGSTSKTYTRNSDNTITTTEQRYYPWSGTRYSYGSAPAPPESAIIVVYGGFDRVPVRFSRNHRAVRTRPQGRSHRANPQNPSGCKNAAAHSCDLWATNLNSRPFD